MALLVHHQLAALERAGLLAWRLGGRLAGAGAAQNRSTRSTSRRCENGLRMKSSAPILRPNSSSISSSLEVRKITGRSDLLAQAAQKLHAVHPRHLDVEDSEIRRPRGEPLKRRGAISIGLDAIAFGFQGDRDGSQNIAVVIDKRDCCHVKRLPHERMSLPSGRGYRRYKLGTNCGIDPGSSERKPLRQWSDADRDCPCQ